MNTVLIFIIITMLPCWLIGMLTFFHWFKKPKNPSDKSNRINNIISWWVGLTRPEVMAHSFEYFKKDVMENIKDD